VLIVLASRAEPVSGAAGLSAHQVAGEYVLRGNLWVLGAVLAWALYTAFARDLVARLGTVRTTAGALGSGAVMFLPFGAWRASQFDFASVPAPAWIGVAYLAVVASTLSYLAWYYAIRRLTPSRVAIFNNVQPVGAAFLAWGLGARPSPAIFAGSALVIGGVILAQRARGG
jgi:drug/metabolite transporter (DMT)-like permease